MSVSGSKKFPVAVFTGSSANPVVGGVPIAENGSMEKSSRWALTPAEAKVALIEALATVVEPEPPAASKAPATSPAHCASVALADNQSLTAVLTGWPLSQPQRPLQYASYDDRADLKSLTPVARSSSGPLIPVSKLRRSSGTAEDVLEPPAGAGISRPVTLTPSAVNCGAGSGAGGAGSSPPPNHDATSCLAPSIRLSSRRRWRSSQAFASSRRCSSCSAACFSSVTYPASVRNDDANSLRLRRATSALRLKTSE